MMKLTARLLKGCTLWMAAVALTTTVHAQTRELQAMVRSVSGGATYSLGSKSGLPLRSGSRLPAGSIVRTGVGGNVELFLGRGAGVVQVKENTTLGLSKLTATDSGDEVLTETELSLPAGEILGNVNKLPSGSHYEIKTPDGLAGVRGTRFRIQVPGGISVLDGTLVFVKDGKTNVVKGPGFFDPGSANPVRPLTPEELPLLRRQFEGGGVPREVAQIPAPAPQDEFLSPIGGRR